MNRRAGVNGAVAGAAALSPLLSACGGGSSRSKGGTNSKSALSAALPDYVPGQAVKPDIPSVHGAAGAFTDPGFLTHPAKQISTVSGAPGKGGSYTAVTPLWGTVPPANNSFCQAVNKALGVNLTIKPANGVSYNTVVPTMTASKKLPDWIQLPTWWNAAFNRGELAGTQLADLTPYLAGDKIKKYPNLAAIPTFAWQVGAWEDKLYGIPCNASGMSLAGHVFYRADILESKGITADQVKSADDYMSLGKELTSAKAGVRAFGDVWTHLSLCTSAHPAPRRPSCPTRAEAGPRTHEAPQGPAGALPLQTRHPEVSVQSRPERHLTAAALDALLRGSVGLGCRPEHELTDRWCHLPRAAG